MSNTIRWGIIGCGNVTEVKSGPGFYKCVGSALVAVMRRDAAKAQDYARRHHVPRWYTDADALIADPEIDAVYVATPPGTHEFYAMKVLTAGKPCHVEKPMSRNSAEGRRMVEGFAKQNLPLFVAYYRRRLPRFLKVQELVGAGTLGRIHTVTYQYADARQARPEDPPHWHVNAEESGGGNFVDLMPHVLDLLDFWFGPLQLVQSRVANVARAYAVEDHVCAGLTASGGIAISLDANFSAPPADEFTITGDKGQLRISCFGNEMVRLGLSDGTTNALDLPNPKHVAMPLIQTVVDDLLHKDQCPSTGVSALRTQVLMDDILRDYYGGREDGFWKREWPGNRR